MSGQLASLRRALAESVIAAARDALATELPRVVLERPPKVELGDLATPAAFDLARVLRKPPRAIAADLAAALRLPPGVASARVEGAGYLNFFLERGAFARALAVPSPSREARPSSKLAWISG